MSLVTVPEKYTTGLQSGRTLAPSLPSYTNVVVEGGAVLESPP